MGKIVADPNAPQGARWVPDSEQRLQRLMVAFAILGALGGLGFIVYRWVGCHSCFINNGIVANIFVSALLMAIGAAAGFCLLWALAAVYRVLRALFEPRRPSPG